MNPYSVDLRVRVIATVCEGETAQTEIAAAFDVSDATVENWWRQWRETGSVQPKPQELCDTVAAQTGVQSSPSMMCRELKLLNLPRKKVAPRQSTRHTAGASPAPRISSARR
jgi:transposase-like protein